MHWLILIKGLYWCHQLTFAEQLEYLLISVKGWNICLHLPKVVQVYLCHKDVLAYLCQRLCRFIDVLAYLCKMFVLACLCQKDVQVYLCQRLYRLTFAERMYWFIFARGGTGLPLPKGCWVHMGEVAEPLQAALQQTCGWVALTLCLATGTTDPTWKHFKWCWQNENGGGKLRTKTGCTLLFYIVFRSSLETFQMVLAEWKWQWEVTHKDWLHLLLSCIVSCMKMFEQRDRQREESNRQKMRRGTGC